MPVLHVRKAASGILSNALRSAVRRTGVRVTRHVLSVHVREQRMIHLRRALAGPDCAGPGGWLYYGQRVYVISTSRYGIGQQQGSNQTPLGLHRVAEKVGGGWPVGTVFRSRKPVGFTWKPSAPAKEPGMAHAPGPWRGTPGATITTRILWLEGLEPGHNRGGAVDSRARYIYIHGTGDETTLGRPASCGCIHLRADDLMPLFDSIPVGTLVWIEP